MSYLYRIANWDAHFETDETRKRESLRWVPMPNKHDGLGFRTVAAQRNSTELYAAWVLMLQIASKAGRGVRGLLARDGEPLTAEDMAVMTGFPKDAFSRALEFFSQRKVNWIIREECAPEMPAETAVGGSKSGTSSVLAAQSAGAPAADAVPPADDAGPPARREGRKEEKENARDPFDRFWSDYPNKVAKEKARASFEKEKCAECIDAVLSGLERDRRSIQWAKDDGQFIPHPTTWLNQRRWESMLHRELLEAPRSTAPASKPIRSPKEIYGDGAE